MKIKNLYKNTLFIGIVLTIISIPAFAAEKEPKDKEIISHLENEYWWDDAVPSNQLNITCNEGIVTLSGSVDNILAKERAQKIVAATVGVRAIINKIEVRPHLNVDDDVVKKKVKNALLLNPATESFEVKVKVNNGSVTLEGKVDSWQEKTLSETVAKGVKGVVEIKNHINIDYKEERLSNEIEQEIKQRLANDVRVDDALIKVEVNDNKVTLSGQVGSLKEKNRAREDAWVRGVESVNNDDLEITWWARDRMRRKELYFSSSDEELAQAIRDALQYDPRVNSSNINLDVEYGYVTLTGIVRNLMAKQAAEEDAENTMGVAMVVNNIKVRPRHIPTDDELKKRVGNALLNDPYIERFKIDVFVFNGTVYLSGKVNTSWEKKRTEKLTEKIIGVVYVVNNIEFAHKWNPQPDWIIKKQVKDELTFSPFVDENQVGVTVADGIVTLTGNVDTYSELQSAENNAYEGGAKDVRNKLTVSYSFYGPE